MGKSLSRGTFAFGEENDTDPMHRTASQVGAKPAGFNPKVTGLRCYRAVTRLTANARSLFLTSRGKSVNEVG